MIARFRALLPFEVQIDGQAVLSPCQFDFEVYRVTVFPPYQAIASSSDAHRIPKVPLLTVVENLQPRNPQLATDTIRFAGNPVIEANAIQIDFWKEDFDRRRGNVGRDDAGDPPLRTVFLIANRYLDAIRSSTGASHIHPIGVDNTFGWLHYLTDAGQDLEPQDGLRRGLAVAHFLHKAAMVETTVWDQVGYLLPTYTPKPWATLLLDAESLLPAVGPALVLAAAALENLIESELDYLATNRGVPLALWTWINERRDRDKNPSVEEQFSSLLEAVTGRSLLRENRDLWDAFMNLKTARNRYLHSGTVSVGGKPVDPTCARYLIANAKEVARWVEEMLPAEERRPPLPSVQVQIAVPLGVPDTLIENQ
jgi:hypothetical protein